MLFLVPFCYGLVSTKASARIEINRIGLIHENDEVSVGKVFFLRRVSLLVVALHGFYAEFFIVVEIRKI